MGQERKQRRHQGSSLMFVIIAVAFVGILATIVLRVTLINVDIKSVDRRAKKDFYSAESVMDKVDLAVQNLALKSMQTSYQELMGQYVSLSSSSANQAQVQQKFAVSYLNDFVKKLSEGTSNVASLQKNGDGSYSLSSTRYNPEKIKGEMQNITDKNGNEVSSFVDIDPADAVMELHFDSSASSEKYLLLKNVHVRYTENLDASNADAGTSAEITTDLRITVPALSFGSTNIYPEFTKYAIIGDDQVGIKSGSASQVNVNGYLYAGYQSESVNGLQIDGGNFSFTGGGNRLITRGDIVVRQGGNITLGSNAGDQGKAEVWTENYRTISSTDTTSKANAALEVYADSYVHDDLSLDSRYSQVAFRSGNYYGYTFNRNNSTGSTVVNAPYSSAILINGKHSSLFMGDDMRSILLGGRAFVSRVKEATVMGASSNTRNDIALGQAVSVKSDQNFYKVSNDELTTGFTNPMMLAQYNAMMDNGSGTNYTLYGVDYQTPLKESVRTSLAAYLDPKEPITTYMYNLSNAGEQDAMVYFYYNFVDEEMADKYFRDMVDKTAMQEKIESSEYLQFGGSVSGLNLNLSPSLMLFSNSNAITKVTQSDMEVREGNINSSNLQSYLNQSIEYASTYKSYEMTLTNMEKDKYMQMGQAAGGADGFDLLKAEKGSSDTAIFDSKLMTKDSASGKFKFVNDATTDPSGTGFDKEVTSSGNYQVKVKAVPVELSRTSNGIGEVSTNAYAIFVADLSAKPKENSVNLSQVMGCVKDLQRDGYQYSYDRMDKRNNLIMVVANCNICVDQDVRGLIMSDGTVDFKGSVSLKADTTGLQNMITAQKKKETSGSVHAFLRYFKCFENFTPGEDDDNSDTVNISQYVTHENWKKNDD